MADLEQIFKTAAAPERTVSLCLRGDLQARHEELSRDLQAATMASKHLDHLQGLGNEEDGGGAGGKLVVPATSKDLEAWQKRVLEESAKAAKKG